VVLNWHEDFIVHLASLVRPKVYVELGLYHCALFNRIIPFAEQLIGVDIGRKPVTICNNLRKLAFLRVQHRSLARK